MKTEEKPKSNKKKAILISLGVVATAVGGFFGFKYLKNRKKKTEIDEEETTPVTTTSSSQTSSSSSSGGYKSTTTTTPTRKDSFPLKKGSKGERVKLFQEKLIAKYGKSILPKYGADGDFGSEMEAALEKLKLPSTISESAYNVYVKGAAPDADDLAEKLIEAAEDKNFSKAIDNLKKIRNTSDYSSVSEKFKEMRINGGVRKTLVTGMLDTFTSSSQQESIRGQFLRMGLKYDGSKWSVPTNFNFFSGIEEPLLITTEPTELYDPKYMVKVKVPKDMVVGSKIKEKNGLTLIRMFEKNRKLIVKSSTVKKYEKH